MIRRKDKDKDKCSFLQPLIRCTPTVFLSKPCWHVTEGGRTPVFILSKGVYIYYFHWHSLKSGRIGSLCSGVLLVRKGSLSYILPMNAKPWFKSTFQLLHTEICPSEFPVLPQGGLPYSFLNDGKLM